LFYADGRTDMAKLMLIVAVLEICLKRERSLHLEYGRLLYSRKYCMEHPFNHASNINIDFFELHKMTPLAPLKTGF
jgi:hypothetical protein